MNTKHLWLVSLGLCLAPLWAEPTDVVLRSEAQVLGTSVLLGEVATLPADSPLAKLDLAPAPLPGSRSWLTADQVQLRLERLGYRGRELRLGGAASVVVTRVGQELRPDVVQAAVSRLLGTPVVIERIPAVGLVPAGQLEFRLRSDVQRPLPPYFTLALDVLVGGQVAARLSVAASLPPEPAPAPLPGPAPLPAVASPTPAAVVPVAVAPARPADPPVPAWQVKRGDRLTVLAHCGRVTIVLSGEARGNGGLGDQIQVEAAIGGAKKTFSVRLLAPDRASLEL